MGCHRPLRGSCSCGRNNYLIEVPENAAQIASVYFDSSSENRRTQAAPLTAWLHIPLSWFHSNTTSFFPDETHSTIRKTFTPAHEPSCKRAFCGFCGTHLTRWSEAPQHEADYVNVTVGSLCGEDLRSLDELGLLPDDTEDVRRVGRNPELSLHGPQAAQSGNRDGQLQRSGRRGSQGDMTWIEEMLEGSRLGRTQKIRRGVGSRADGTTTVEWDITEIVNDGSEGEPGPGRAKRKLDDTAPTSDAHMQL